MPVPLHHRTPRSRRPRPRPAPLARRRTSVCIKSGCRVREHKRSTNYQSSLVLQALPAGSASQSPPAAAAPAPRVRPRSRATTSPPTTSPAPAATRPRCAAAAPSTARAGLAAPPQRPGLCRCVKVRAMRCSHPCFPLGQRTARLADLRVPEAEGAPLAQLRIPAARHRPRPHAAQRLLQRPDKGRIVRRKPP